MFFKKKVLFISILVLITMLMSGCNKNEQAESKVYGGELLRYSLCIEEDSSQIVSCPIVINKRVDNISLNTYTSEQKELLSVTMNTIDMNEYFQYDGYYVYFAILNIGCVKNDEMIDTKIDKLLLDIDGELVEYITPYFNIRNTSYYCQTENCKIEDECIKISGEFTGIYGYIPDNERKLDLMLVSDNNVKLKSFILLDFISVDNMTLNGKNVNNKSLNVDVTEKEDVSIEYTIKFDDKTYKDCIVRSSQIVIYEYNNQDYLWVYTSGVYIWNDYNDYGNIKRYIDTL